ncbi:MFS transporter [Kitasatospora sp. NPDC056138]|uniref:MFS transporter n=1 Tax=Kitasatospora sp. NPDC056138 TaxID=3345724 RepID=UPI0035DB72C4
MRSLVLFFVFSSLAEGGQAVVLLWLTYALTSNALLIGVVVVLGYLPAALVGLLFSRVADRGRADRMARSTNSVLSVTSFLLAAQQFTSGRSVALSMTVISLSQVVLSIAKMTNKAALNRLIRNLFDRDTARRLMGLTSSSSLIGQVVGAGLAGLFLAQRWVVGGLLFAAVAYGLSALFMTLGTRGYTEPGERAEEESGQPEGQTPMRWSFGLVAVLLFSIPSSGGLQFMTTLLVPLADAVAPNQPSFYAVLNIVSIGGGFLAGVLLSTSVVSSRQVLAWALPIAGALALLLAFFHLKYLVVLECFALVLVITCHVICMQVMTNQAPRDHEIGQFAVMRNVVASLAKAVFSFAAGALVGLCGISGTSAVLAAALACFALAWPALRSRWRVPGIDVP